jgi:mRNA-degrading endonuclease RelE of RelBE toxin-antitoxin system
MSYKVETIPNFEREAKRLIKKYRSLKKELSELVSELQENPDSGTSIGKGIYKIRLAIASKGKGKSGGARVITQFKVIKKTVFLISIYHKSEKEDIPDKELELLLKQLPQ